MIDLDNFYGDSYEAREAKSKQERRAKKGEGEIGESEMIFKAS